MALIICRECGGTVSSLANSCPHCGCPVMHEENTICTISGVSYDLKEVLVIARSGEKSMHYRGQTKIEKITGLSFTSTSRLWSAILHSNKIPETFITAEEEKLYKKPTVPKCPTCGSTGLIKKGVGARMIDGFVFGRLSVEGRSQFQCRKCGYMW